MATVPPKLGRSAAASWLLAGLLGAGLCLGLWVIYLFDPTHHHFYPICQFHRLTGWYCPGCGMTRALYALLHGQWLTACHDNILLVVAPPAALARALWWYPRRQQHRFLPNRWFWSLVFLTLTFGVVRNQPQLTCLAPAP